MEDEEKPQICEHSVPIGQFCPACEQAKGAIVIRCVHGKLAPPHGSCRKCQEEFEASEAERKRSEEERNKEFAKVAQKGTKGRGKPQPDRREWHKLRHVADQAILAALLAMEGDAVRGVQPRQISSRVPEFGKPGYEEWAITRLENTLIKIASSPKAREHWLFRLHCLYVEQLDIHTLGPDWHCIEILLEVFRRLMIESVNQFPWRENP